MQTFTPYKALTRIHAIFAFAFIAVLSFCACSNSEGVDYANYAEIADDNDVPSDGDYPQTQDASSSSKVIDYLPLDDTEYPYAGIPRIVIETENNREIKDRETEIPAKLQIWGEKAPESEIMPLTIRGRGNSSWTLPKKSYKIEFTDKQGLLGMPKDRDWALIANHYDTTMIRNYIANYISGMSNTLYTPKNRFVEFFLNGKYKGTYQLFETLKISKSRINIGKENFLLEVDNHPKTKDVSFYVVHIPSPIKIHSSSISKNDSIYNYIQKEICHIDSVLFSNNFLDDEIGYRKYIDIDALVDWFAITEITKNASSRLNWYMTYERGKKLKMGPFWDYDLAFGNTLWGLDANNVPGFWTDSISWFTRFSQDSVFKHKATERLDYFYNKKESILDEIDNIAQSLKQSAVQNDKLWNVLNCTSCSRDEIEQKYNEHVLKMKNWLIQRLEWLKETK